MAIKAEVGLLSRNIKVTGDSSSYSSNYGAHLKLSGQVENGFEAQVAYSEFTLCGQPQIPGRYCLYFHMNGEVPNSYAKGNSVHESFGRVVTMHGVHLLTVEENIGFRARGHNFFFVDGSETRNIIRRNLAVSTLINANMYQSDLSIYSFNFINQDEAF